jgi:hypothetical protein
MEEAVKTEEVQGSDTHSAAIRTVTLTYRAAYKNDSPVEVLSAQEPYAVLYEFLRGPIEVDSIRVSVQRNEEITDDFGSKHENDQREVLDAVLAKVLGEMMLSDL